MTFERSSGDAVPVEPAGGPLDDAFLDTPNCPVCLHRMEADESAAGVPFWACAACGTTRVA